MSISRRDFLAMMPLAAAAAAGSSYAMLDSHVRLKVLGPDGKPVPYATVWGYVLPRKSPTAVSGEDLDRLAERYESSVELVTPSNRPVPNLLVLPLTDAEGTFDWTVNYKDLEGAAALRPPRLALGCLVMKRGFAPVRVDFEGTTGTRFDREVVMQSKGSTPSPYLAQLDHLRFEVARESANLSLTVEKYDRLQRLRSDLQTIAEAAERSGDRSAAAVIYARMQYLPEILMSGDKPIGYSRSEPEVTESLKYVAKAYQLDSSNSYAASRMAFRRGADEFGGTKFDPLHASPQQREAFESYLKQLDELMAKQGNEIWPDYHLRYAFWVRKSPRKEIRDKFPGLIDQLARWEPKFRTREQLEKFSKLPA